MAELSAALACGLPDSLLASAWGFLSLCFPQVCLTRGLLALGREKGCWSLGSLPAEEQVLNAAGLEGEKMSVADGV